jgi:hypothetical protein
MAENITSYYEPVKTLPKMQFNPGVGFLVLCHNT